MSPNIIAIMNNRRTFLRTTATGLLAGFSLLQLRTRAAGAPAAAKFSLGYAPHPGMFRHSAGDNVLDQIKYAADQGFTAWEDNGIAGQSPEMQEKIGQLLASLNMQMGVFVAYGSFDEPTFTVPHPDTQKQILDTLQNAVQVAKRCGAKCMTVVPGSVDQQAKKEGKDWNRYGGPRLAEGFQTANAIDMLRRAAAVLEPHQLIMVLEPLNWHRDHGGVFLRYSDQAYALCKAVQSPACKILFDIYHQQITEGNLLPNIDRCWDEIAYFQSGDNPGRQEPTTGEINYRNVFAHLRKKGWKGVIGMEHGISRPGKEGEAALVRAYREVDAS
jgi:hydroxypyruvate isomerase